MDLFLTTVHYKKNSRQQMSKVFFAVTGRTRCQRQVAFFVLFY